MASANYVLIESDIAVDPTAAGVDVYSDLTGALGLGSQEYVRRPLRGVQLKRDVFATIAVVGGVGGTALKNSSAPPSMAVNFSSNFLLQSVQETRQEKFQAITTFGAPYGFFFGEQPRMLSCNAVLLNTADFQWEAEWWENYDQYLRGTRLVDRGARAVLTYEDVVIEGYLVQASTTKSEPNVWAVNLNFTMWVTGVTYLIDVGGPKVDSFHAGLGDGRSPASEFDEFDSDTTGAPSMLEEVRARNIAALATSGTGLIGALQSAVETVNTFTDKVGAAIDGALDWLYGRNMVIPAGFAGSERIAGPAAFAEGTGVWQITTAGGKVSLTSATVTVRAPVSFAARIQPKGNFFDDNYDEYPARYTAGNSSAPEAEVALADPAIAFSEMMFSQFGINVLNSEGQHTPALLRALGRVTFAVISYAAMGADAQDAAALLATATSADFISASAEQGVGEALR